MTFTSLYIHIPFCLHRCGYCDFNTYAGLQRLIPEYADALCREIAFLSHHAEQPLTIHTIYFGGGTPTLLPPDELKNIMDTIRASFRLAPSLEISLEANPGTISREYIQRIYDLGVNRVSLGMQSAQQGELALLERQHTYSDVVNAVEWVRGAGIGNLNLDLIFGLPDQTLASWMVSLEAALSLQPEHLSLYALTLEHGTPLHHKIEQGMIKELDPDVAADMYEAAQERMVQAGFVQYEISNWARFTPTGELYSCRHNLQYWRGLPYIGAGAGAHGFIGHYRTQNVSTPGSYIKRMVHADKALGNPLRFPCTPATTHLNFIDTETEIGEMMMMGLRLVSEGVHSQEFQTRFAISLQERFGAQIDRLISLGLLEWVGEHEEILRLSDRGHLLGNQVFKEFI